MNLAGPMRGRGLRKVCPLQCRVLVTMPRKFKKNVDVELVLSVQLFAKFPTYVVLIHQRYRQTDRQTADGRRAIAVPRFAL